MLAVDVPQSALTFRYFAELSDKVEGSVTATAVDAFHYTLREPLGVVGCITPWNYPLMQIAWKIAPALAAGNCVVLKPAEQAPLSALLLAAAVRRGRRPAGRVQRRQRFRRGCRRAARAAQRRREDLVYRLDGDRQENARLRRPVEHEARQPRMRRQVAADLPGRPRGPRSRRDVRHQRHLRRDGRGLQRRVAPARRQARLRQNSRRASSSGAATPTSRAIRSIRTTNMGPLVTQKQHERVLGYVAKGRDEGAKLEFGGDAPDRPGYYVNPTLVHAGRQRHDDRAGGNLRSGRRADRGRRPAGRAAHRQRHDLRPGRVGVDDEPALGPRSRARSRSGHASASTASITAIRRSRSSGTSNRGRAATSASRAC